MAAAAEFDYRVSRAHIIIYIILNLFDRHLCRPICWSRRIYTSRTTARIPSNDWGAHAIFTNDRNKWVRVYTNKWMLDIWWYKYICIRRRTKKKRDKKKRTNAGTNNIISCASCIIIYYGPVILLTPYYFHFTPYLCDLFAVKQTLKSDTLR